MGLRRGVSALPKIAVFGFCARGPRHCAAVARRIVRRKSDTAAAAPAPTPAPAPAPPTDRPHCPSACVRARARARSYAFIIFYNPMGDGVQCARRRRRPVTRPLKTSAKSDFADRRSVFIVVCSRFGYYYYVFIIIFIPYFHGAPETPSYPRRRCERALCVRPVPWTIKKKNGESTVIKLLGAI